MPGNSNFTNNQLKFLKKIESHKKNNAIIQTSNSVLHPLTFITTKVDNWLFGSKNTVHEKCTMVTEETITTLVTSSISLEDFTQVTEKVNYNFRNQLHSDGILFLDGIVRRLENHICRKLINNNSFTTHSLSQVESILNSSNNVSIDNNFNPTNFADYQNFVSGILTSSNQNTLLEEAKIALNKVELLTLRVLLTRGLAYAILNHATNINTTSYKEEFEIEAKTALLLHTAALTHSTRESTIRTLDNEYATKHPIRHKLLSITNYFNANISNTVSWAYVAAIISIFLTRVYSGYASERAENDIISALGSHNITFNHTRYYRHDTNQNTNLSTVIFAPRHPSEYFPEYEGLLNGAPVYLTTLMSTIQLFLTLPNIILSQHKSKFMACALNKYSPTPTERVSSKILLSVLILRWVGNVVVQPVDCIDSAYKDIFFKWSIFRLFTPSAPLEEPLKIQCAYTSIQRNCYRSTESIILNNKIMYLSSATVLALEYLDTYLGFPFLACSMALKGTRLASVIIPVLTNRNKICYSKDFKKLILANMLRTGSSLFILPAFDIFGNSIRHLSLITALDVGVTVNVDAISSNIIMQANRVEQQLMVIEDMIENTIITNKASLALLSTHLERKFQRHRDRITICEILDTNEDEDHDHTNQNKKANSEQSSTSQHSIIDIEEDDNSPCPSSVLSIQSVSHSNPREAIYQ